MDAYTNLNLRYSQNAPITMWDERNTGTNLPAQIELYADTAPGHELAYKFLFMAKGGGSANKSYLFQETKAILNPDSMMQFLEAKIRSLGAPPPARPTTWPSLWAAPLRNSPSRPPSTPPPATWIPCPRRVPWPDTASATSNSKSACWT